MRFVSICLGLSVGLAARSSPSAKPRIVAITAKRFKFTPGEIVLKKGEQVTLQLTSQDVKHGLFLKSLGLDAELVPGKTVEVLVTPQAVGKFTAICDNFGGAQHGNMKITVLVTE